MCNIFGFTKSKMVAQSDIYFDFTKSQKAYLYTLYYIWLNKVPEGLYLYCVTCLALQFQFQFAFRCVPLPRLWDRKHATRWIKLVSHHKPWEILYVYFSVHLSITLTLY
jgi:hypothetical protein